MADSSGKKLEFLVQDFGVSKVVGGQVLAPIALVSFSVTINGETKTKLVPAQVVQEASLFGATALQRFGFA